MESKMLPFSSCNLQYVLCSVQCMYARMLCFTYTRYVFDKNLPLIHIFGRAINTHIRILREIMSIEPFFLLFLILSSKIKREPFH
jgi:hypothetical protein